MVKGRYRGTVWDWSVLVVVAGVLLVLNGTIGGYPVATVIGMALAALGAWLWLRRRGLKARRD